MKPNFNLNRTSSLQYSNIQQAIQPISPNQLLDAIKKDATSLFGVPLFINEKDIKAYLPAAASVTKVKLAQVVNGAKHLFVVRNGVDSCVILINSTGPSLVQASEAEKILAQSHGLLGGLKVKISNQRPPNYNNYTKGQQRDSASYRELQNLQKNLEEPQLLKAMSVQEKTLTDFSSEELAKEPRLQQTISTGKDTLVNWTIEELTTLSHSANGCERITTLFEQTMDPQQFLPFYRFSSHTQEFVRRIYTEVPAIVATKLEGRTKVTNELNEMVFTNINKDNRGALINMMIDTIKGAQCDSLLEYPLAKRMLSELKRLNNDPTLKDDDLVEKLGALRLDVYASLDTLNTAEQELVEHINLNYEELLALPLRNENANKELNKTNLANVKEFCIVNWDSLDKIAQLYLNHAAKGIALDKYNNLTFHHITPVTPFLDKMNILLEKNLSNPDNAYILTTLAKIRDSLDAWINHHGVKNSYVALIKQAVEIINQILKQSKTLDGEGDNLLSEDDIEILTIALGYFPSNGFLGPTNIPNDPGNKFDTLSQYFMAPETYSVAASLDKATTAPEIAQALNLMMAQDTGYAFAPYNQDKWAQQLKDPKYYHLAIGGTLKERDKNAIQLKKAEEQALEKSKITILTPEQETEFATLAVDVNDLKQEFPSHNLANITMLDEFNMSSMEKIESITTLFGNVPIASKDNHLADIVAKYGKLVKAKLKEEKLKEAIVQGKKLVPANQVDLPTPDDLTNLLNSITELEWTRLSEYKKTDPLVELSPNLKELALMCRNVKKSKNKTLVLPVDKGKELAALESIYAVANPDVKKLKAVVKKLEPEEVKPGQILGETAVKGPKVEEEPTAVNQ